jgi:flavin-dependent dehydrogenase
MYDAIIVGARCAGSPLGMLLARQGHRVLIVDRDTFPSDTLSTTFLQQEACARLERWGLLDRVLAPNLAAPATLMANIMGMSMPVPGKYPFLAPRRTYFDKLLVDAAREAGAEVREGFSVQSLLRDDSGAVSGISGQTASASGVEETARVVVGADGRNSAIARMVGAEEYRRVEGQSCGFYSYWTGLPTDQVNIFITGPVFAFTFPSHDGQVCAGLEVSMDHWQELRADPEAFIIKTFEPLNPGIAEALRGATRVEKMLGMSAKASFLRKPYGPGWALAGDAAYLKDPIQGTGVDDAFRDADHLSESLHSWLSGVSTFEAAMAAHHTRRDEEQIPRYDLICELAKMKPFTPEIMMRMAEDQARNAATVAAL